MTRVIDRLGGIFWTLCLGIVVLFVFFAAIGGINPGDVLWLTVIVALLGLAFIVRTIFVGRVLRKSSRSSETMRSLNELRERRGF